MTEIFTPLTQRFNERRPSILVLHGTQVDWTETNAILRGQTSYEASCHYAISQQGEVVKFLDHSARGWHAGLSYWGGFTDINSLSIGIELECVCKDDTFSYPENTYSKAQMDALKKLAVDMTTENKIKPHHILAHQDIAPYRKNDPGINFDWEGLASSGLGAWHGLTEQKNDAEITDPKTIDEFRVLLGLYGYDVRPNKDGKDFSSVIRAFQTHFLPWNICGKVTEQSLAAIIILLQKKYQSE
jgi:N-acetyl-anhydromuramyl-L-alanine amidase AmpD